MLKHINQKFAVFLVLLATVLGAGLMTADSLAASGHIVKSPDGRTHRGTTLSSKYAKFHSKGHLVGKTVGKAVAPTTPAATSGFNYVYGAQAATATGAFVSLYQAKPALSTGDYHSLAELSVQSANQQQTVEIGWNVDRGVNNGDTNPHLFVFHWVNGQGTCYNACGFVSTSSFTPGTAVTVGQTATYGIEYSGGNWWLYYNGQWIGYFPGTIWGGTYTTGGYIQAFGEVAYGTNPSCTDMGNGIFGHANGSATISNFSLVGSTSKPALNVYETTPKSYDYGAVTPTSFRFGGPGAC